MCTSVSEIDNYRIYCLYANVRLSGHRHVGYKHAPLYLRLTSHVTIWYNDHVLASIQGLPVTVHYEGLDGT